MLLLTIFSFAAVAILALFLTSNRSDEARHCQVCERLDELHGGSWLYDPATDTYRDWMTDRCLSAKDAE